MTAAAPKAAPSAQEVALYQGFDRQELLERGAASEGKVMVYTSAIVAMTVRPLADAFEAKYPYLKVEIFRADETDLVQKAQQEYRAGRREVDVWETTPSGLMAPRQAGILQPFWSPHLARYEAESLDKDGFHAGVREGYVGLGYNTSLLSKEEVPKTYEDLTHPRWQGKMSIAGSSTGARWVGSLVQSRGQDFLRRLAQQDIRVQNVSGRALADLVIAGEVPLSPTIFYSHVEFSRERGAPIDWVPLEPVVTNLGSVALAKDGPHPHAGLLFIDFLLSEEGQRIYIAGGYYSPRTDMGGRASYRKIYLENSPTYLKDFETWQRLMRDLFMRSQER